MNIPEYIKIIKRGAICCVLFFTLLSHSYAGQQVETDVSGKPLMLYFRFDKALVDSGYMDNRRTLRHIDEILTDHHYLCERIDSINIFSFASPDGNRAYNERLARQRSVAVKGFLVWKYPHLDQYRIHPRPQGENWQELRRLIAGDKHLPNREEVLQIIDRIPDADRCKALLRKLDGGRSYRYIEENLLRYLRNAAVCMVWIRPDSLPALHPAAFIHPDSMKTKTATRICPPHESGNDNLISCGQESSKETSGKDILPTVIPSRQESPSGASGTASRHHPLFALKTNLLFDAALMPNVEIEVPIGNRWSVNGEYMFPWWLLDGDKYSLQILTGGLEGRYWLSSRENRMNREALTGHFIGLYAGGGKYDLQWKENGYQGEFFIAAGISYGYARRIARNLHLEFNIGVGMLRTDYRHYHARDNYKTLMWQENGKYTWFGPTKVKISLVWLLNRKVKTVKGGER